MERGGRSFPWYKISETTAKSEDIEAISDYLLSGGQFIDIQVPIMYLKKLFDTDSLILYNAAVIAKLTAGVPPQIKTLVDALREILLGRIPRRARLINMIDRPMKINQMGDEGQNLHSFSEGLILDMEQSG